MLWRFGPGFARIGDALRGHFGTYAVVLVLICATGVWAGTALFKEAMTHIDRAIFVGTPAAAPDKTATAAGLQIRAQERMTRLSGHVVLTQSPWVYRPRDRWDSRRRYDDDWEDREDRPESETYRTVCVRLCDGFYFPISYSTTREFFGRDQATCERTCGSPSRLFVQQLPNTDAENLYDLNGQSYSRLKNAFLFRTKYEESCRCTPQPWDQISLDRHRMYTLEAARRKGDKIASEELKTLREKLAADSRQKANDARRQVTETDVSEEATSREDVRTAARPRSEDSVMRLGRDTPPNVRPKAPSSSQSYNSWQKKALHLD